MIIEKLYPVLRWPHPRHINSFLRTWCKLINSGNPWRGEVWKLNSSYAPAQSGAIRHFQKHVTCVPDSPTVVRWARLVLGLILQCHSHKTLRSWIVIDAITIPSSPSHTSARSRSPEDHDQFNVEDSCNISACILHLGALTWCKSLALLPKLLWSLYSFPYTTHRNCNASVFRPTYLCVIH